MDARAPETGPASAASPDAPLSPGETSPPVSPPDPGEEAPAATVEALSPKDSGYTVDTEWGERVNEYGIQVESISVADDGTLYIMDPGRSLINKLSSTGELELQWPFNGAPAWGSDYGFGIGVRPDGELIYALTYSGDIQVFWSNGNAETLWHTPVPKWAGSISVGERRVYVAEAGLFDFLPDGDLIAVRSRCSGRSLNCLAVAASPDAIYVIGTLSDGPASVLKLDEWARPIWEWGDDGIVELPAEDPLFPWDLAVSDEGEVYVTDGRFLQRIDSEGNLIAPWEFEGDPHFSPCYVDLDAAGNIYVADWISPILKLEPPAP
ncbi:MAG: hypothetical protein GF393_11445 [Armatimonadia bacterium]|nr:hypothetical protein [Armatimonadia bacterium]